MVFREGTQENEGASEIWKINSDVVQSGGRIARGGGGFPFQLLSKNFVFFTFRDIYQTESKKATTKKTKLKNW